MEGEFSPEDIDSESGLVKPDVIPSDDEQGYWQRVWHVFPVESNNGAMCCPSPLTDSLRNAATHQLVGLRVFPHPQVGGEEIIRIHVMCSRNVYLVCRNQMTATSAYHLLHLLHHLNGSSIYRLVTTSDGLTNDGIHLEPAVLTALTGAYMKSGVFPAQFKLYSRKRVHTEFPPHAELMPEQSLSYEQIIFQDCQSDDLGYELRWISTSLNGDMRGMGTGKGLENLISFTAPRVCRLISFGTSRYQLDTEIERIINASRFANQRLLVYRIHCINRPWAINFQLSSEGGRLLQGGRLIQGGRLFFDLPEFKNLEPFFPLSSFLNSTHILPINRAEVNTNVFQRRGAPIARRRGCPCE